VISAHRWKFRPPDTRTFYNIDKLAVGDEIKIFWQGKAYYYRVRETKVVTPDQTEILYPTKEPQLTLFSCTPLFSTSHRLVVVADLEKVE
jgi:sortase A